MKSHKFSWAELESLITSPTISGKQLYVGNAERPNYLTWLITLNGASLSTDLSQRVVEVCLAEPEYTEDWEERVAAYVEARRMEIVADLIGLLRGPPKKLRRHARWAAWEAEVLGRCNEPDETLDLILERRREADAEVEEAATVEDYFRGRLKGLGFDPEIADVFLPSTIVAEWFNRCTGERRKSIGVAKTLQQMYAEGQQSRLVYYRGGSDGRRGFRWIGEHSPMEEPIDWSIGKKLAEQRCGADTDSYDGGEKW